MLQASAKVWVIGAASFTGQYLIPALQAANYQVITTDVDITQAKEVEGALLQIQPNYIINLAGISFVPDGESAEIYAINTFGPQNILDASLKLKKAPTKIILASSSLIYGQQKQETIDESCIANPTNHYGCSKWAMEQIAQNYQDKLNIVITRPFNYTGVAQNNKFLVPKIVEHFKKREPIIKLGNIDIWRDFSDVRWVANVYTQLLTAETGAGINSINVCSGRLTSIRDIINQLQELSGHELDIKSDADFIRISDMQKQSGDNSKLYNYLTNLAAPIGMKELLSWMVAS